MCLHSTEDSYTLYPINWLHLVTVVSIPLLCLTLLLLHLSPVACLGMFHLVSVTSTVSFFCYIAWFHLVIVTSISLLGYTLLLLHLSRCRSSLCYCYNYPVAGVHFFIVTSIPLLVFTLLLLHLSRCRSSLCYIYPVAGGHLVIVTSIPLQAGSQSSSGQTSCLGEAKVRCLLSFTAV